MELQKWTMYLFINPRSIKELWKTILLVSLHSIQYYISIAITKLYRREAREQICALEISFTIFGPKGIHAGLSHYRLKVIQ